MLIANEVAKVLTSLGLGVHISKGSERTIIGVIGDKRKLSDVPLELMNGVEKLIPIVESYKLASKTFKPEPSVIDVGGVKNRRQGNCCHGRSLCR